MRITKVLFGLLLLLCVACDKSEKETPSGMKFKVIKSGGGQPGKPNDILVFNFKLVDSKDSVWADTYAMGMPAMIMINDTSAIKTEDGMMQMLRMVAPGDSVTVEFTMVDFFKNMAKAPIPPGVDSTLNIIYQLKIDTITTRDGAMDIQQALMEKNQKAQLEKDMIIIDEFLASKNIQAQKTESGLRYIITQPGMGENGTAGQTAKVNYAGYLLDGQYFDTSIKAVAEEKGIYKAIREPYTPYEVIIDQTSVIKGWHEALKQMNKGAKGTFYIPSPLGYGPQQKGAIIKPNSILVFDLEVIDLK